MGSYQWYTVGAARDMSLVIVSTLLNEQALFGCEGGAVHAVTPLFKL